MAAIKTLFSLVIIFLLTASTLAEQRDFQQSRQFECNNSLELTTINDSRLKSNLIKALSFLLPSIRNLKKLYHNQIQGKVTEENNVFQLIADALDIKFNYENNFEKQVPAEGGLISVVNNSVGHVNAIGAMLALLNIRKDVKILGNEILWNVPELRPYLIPFDMRDEDLSFARKDKNKMNLEKALRHVKNGGALVILPGEDMATNELVLGRAFESRWKNTYGNLIKDAQSPILPLYVKSDSTATFNFMSNFGKAMRITALARELKTHRHQEFDVKLGNLVYPENLEKLNGRVDSISDALRTHSLLMGGDDEVIVGYGSRHIRKIKRRLENVKLFKKKPEKIVDPLPKEDVEVEINALPLESVLLEVIGKKFFLIKKNEQTEKILHEVGRLREEVFRAENEGTGKSIDLDEYDEAYYHLVAWDTKDKEVIGSYRLGLHQKKLYSQSLFNYSDEFLNSLGVVLELGRSFIIEKHRKRLLPYIFMALGEVFYRNPEIDSVMGPVSISGDRSLVSMLVTTSYLMQKHKGLPQQSRLVKAPNPFTVKTHFSPASMFNFLQTIGDLRQLGKYVQSLEGNKELPPLIKIYVDFGVAFYGFNVDYDFNRAVDGMIAGYLDNFTKEILLFLFNKDSEKVENYLKKREAIRRERLKNQPGFELQY